MKASERLARQIAQEILSDGPRDGAMLPAEGDMAVKYEVGRSTVREALRLLETWGVVRVKMGRGGGPETQTPTARNLAYHLAVVMQFDGTTLADVLDVGKSLDLWVAARAAEFMTDAQVLELGETVRGLVESVHDRDAFEHFNTRFYEVLANGCRNQALRTLLLCMRTLGAETMLKWVYPEDWRAQSAVLRGKVFRAIASGNPVEATAQMAVYRDSITSWWSEHYPEEMSRPIDVLTLGSREE